MLINHILSFEQQQQSHKAELTNNLQGTYGKPESMSSKAADT